MASHENSLSRSASKSHVRVWNTRRESNILGLQGNICCAYERLGRLDEALVLRKEVYSGYVKLLGESDRDTLLAASNYAASLRDLRRFEEARLVLRKTMPVARRVFGNCNLTTLRMRKIYASALCADPAATLNGFREGVTTFEDTERTARRVLGGAHPFTTAIERELQDARAALRARESS